MERFSQCFAGLPDPRADNAQHDLTEILFIALLATLCGAQTCCDIALFAKTKEALLRTVLVLAHGVPSHDTFSRVFRMLDAQAFEKAFRRFMRAFAETAQGVVALDGKALRRAYESGKSHMPPIMVTAWSAQTRMALANVMAEGNNEAAAAVQLVGLLTLKGCVVTADALHCHRAMAASDPRTGWRLRACGQGQPARFAARCARPPSRRQRAGARARRSPPTIVMVARRPEWPWSPPAGDYGRAARLSRSASGCQDHEQAQWQDRRALFLLSRQYRSAELLRIVRQHWSIENGLHWPLDVLLDEDFARSRKDNAPANLAVLRRLALNVARAHPDTKTSLRGKLKRAGWDDAFLFDMLRHMR